MMEEWRPVKGFEELYECSTLGNIRAKERFIVSSNGQQKHILPKLIKVYETGLITLHTSEGYTSRYARSLIADTFLNIPYGESITHLDRNYLNNAPSNLIRTSDYYTNDDEWRDVVGFEGLYQVSKHGQVRSLDRYTGQQVIKYCKGVLKEHDIDEHGYCVVSLYDSKHKPGYSRMVHVLVAQAFIDNPDPDHKDQVNHLDGDKQNNDVTNLEWCTAKENNEHARRTGLWVSTEENAEKMRYYAKLNNEKRMVPVRCIETGVEYPSYSEAGRAFNCGAIEIKISAEKHKAHKGYHFVKASEPDYDIHVSLDLPEEEWRDIPGYEGMYQISNQCRIKSLRREVACPQGSRAVPEKILSTSSGQITLNKQNKTEYFNVKKLYSYVFIGKLVEL